MIYTWRTVGHQQHLQVLQLAPLLQVQQQQCPQAASQLQQLQQARLHPRVRQQQQRLLLPVQEHLLAMQQASVQQAVVQLQEHQQEHQQQRHPLQLHQALQPPPLPQRQMRAHPAPQPGAGVALQVVPGQVQVAAQLLTLFGPRCHA
jgi:hypothetical protein